MNTKKSNPQLLAWIFGVIVLLCIAIPAVTGFMFWLNNRPQSALTFGEPGDHLIVTSAQRGMDTTFTAVGLLRQQGSDSTLIAIPGGARLDIQSAEVLQQSADGNYLIIGDQTIEVATWSLVSFPGGDRAPTVASTPQVSTNPSPSGRLRFTLQTSRGESPLFFHDWQLLIFEPNRSAPLLVHRGAGQVIRLGWDRVEQNIYVETEAGIVAIPLP